MKYNLLKAMIEYIEAFETEHNGENLEAFTLWLNNQLFVAKPDTGHSTHDELLITFKIMHLNKTLKKETKQILAQSQVSSIDEYSFLLHLKYQSSFRKMEIIEMHNLEAPTGIEIIKRLLRNNLIEEFKDPEDKRAKRIKITPEGITEIEHLKPLIDSCFANFTKVLSLNEKIQLSGILTKLIL